MAKGSLSSLNIQLYTLGFLMGRVGISTQLTPVCFSAACDCNGRSQECYFDPELYRSTGHGGHCMGCRDNTDGAHCERCRDSFYRLGSEEGCLPCSCNPVGKCKGSAADGEPGSGKAFLPFLITARIGDVYSVVLWLKLSLDLTGLGVAGADSSPLQHLLLQMCSKIVVFIFFSTTVYVLPWTHPALKHSFKFLINKITRADILGNSLHRRMVVNISSISFSYWVSKHYKYKPVKP